MHSPVEGNIFTVGTKQTLTFVCGFNMASLPTRNGSLVNLTAGSNTTMNNTDISVTDNATGTLQVSANLSVAGDYLAQFAAANSTTLKQYSPEFQFKVVAPIITGL